MYKIDDPSAVGARPAPDPIGVPGWFRDGNQSLGIQGTVVTADWLNMIQVELGNLRGIGIPYGVVDPLDDKSDDSQLKTVLDAWFTARLNTILPLAYPPTFITGLRRSVPDLSVDGSLVDFHPGNARAVGLGVGNLGWGSSPMRKDISLPWAVGNAGGWPSALGAPSSFGWVTAFIIGREDGLADFGWDVDMNAANLLADATGYVWARAIGFDEVLPGDVIRSFRQYPGRLDYVEWARPKSLLQDQDVSGWTSGTTLATGTPPGTTAHLAVSHSFPDAIIGGAAKPIARFYPADDPTYDETLSPTSWSVKMEWRDLGFDEQASQGPAFPFDVWGGSASTFRAKYGQLPGAGLPILASFVSLGYFWDRKEVIT